MPPAQREGQPAGGGATREPVRRCEVSLAMPAPSGLWMNLLLAERADAAVSGCFCKDLAVAVLAAHRVGPDLFPAQRAFARGVRLLVHTSALPSGTCRGYRRGDHRGLRAARGRPRAASARPTPPPTRGWQRRGPSAAPRPSRQAEPGPDFHVYTCAASAPGRAGSQPGAGRSLRPGALPAARTRGGPAQAQLASSDSVPRGSSPIPRPAACRGPQSPPAAVRSV
jgi:hypothetical protein